MITDKMIDDFLEIGKDFCFDNKNTARSVLKEALESKGYEVERPKSRFDNFLSFTPRVYTRMQIINSNDKTYDEKGEFVPMADYIKLVSLASEAFTEIISQNSPISTTVKYKERPNYKELKKRLKRSKKDRLKKVEKIKELEDKVEKIFNDIEELLNVPYIDRASLLFKLDKLKELETI